MSVAAVVGYKVYNQSRMSAFMKANIEALTDAESGLGCSELAPMKLLIVVCIGVNHVVQNGLNLSRGQ